MISERDLFGLQRLSMQGLRKEIAHAETVDALAFAAREVRELGTAMLAQGVAAEQLTQFVSALNDAVTERAIELALRNHDVADTGFCWMGLGSEGRNEQTLATDQDNAIIFPDRDGEDREATRAAPPRVRRRGEPDAGRLRVPALQGQHHGAQPRLVPEPRASGSTASTTGSATPTRRRSSTRRSSSTSARCTATRRWSIACANSCWRT